MKKSIDQDRILNNKEIKYLVRYLINGIFNTVLGYLLIFTLMNFGVNHLLSNFLGYLIGFFWSFAASKFFIFNSNGKIYSEVLLFSIFYLISFSFNIIFLVFLLNYYDANPYLAQLESSFIFSFSMYLFSRIIIFKLDSRTK